MIKGDESDVGNIDFELQLQIDINIFYFYRQLTIRTLQPEIHLPRGLDQNVAFLKCI